MSLLKLRIDALDLLIELWPEPRTSGAYLTEEQWSRLRQFLIRVGEQGENL